MDDLRKRFGLLVAAHRRGRRMTQEKLAEATDLSVDMISKIEIGATGARFPVIERIAKALDVDPAELFTTQVPTGHFRRGAFADLSVRLAGLTEIELTWVDELLDAIMKRPTAEMRSPRVTGVLGLGGPAKVKASNRGKRFTG